MKIISSISLKENTKDQITVMRKFSPAEAEFDPFLSALSVSFIFSEERSGKHSPQYMEFPLVIYGQPVYGSLEAKVFVLGGEKGVKDLEETVLNGILVKIKTQLDLITNWEREKLATGPYSIQELDLRLPRYERSLSKLLRDDVQEEIEEAMGSVINHNDFQKAKTLLSKDDIHNPTVLIHWFKNQYGVLKLKELLFKEKAEKLDDRLIILNWMCAYEYYIESEIKLINWKDIDDYKSRLADFMLNPVAEYDFPLESLLNYYQYKEKPDLINTYMAIVDTLVDNHLNQTFESCKKASSKYSSLSF